MNEIGKTPGEVSQTLNVTGATLRNYCRNFKTFLTENATLKTRKRFNPSDIETLKVAKSFLDAGLTYEQVSERLENLPLTGDILEDIQTETEPEPSPEDFQTSDMPSAIQTREFYEQFFKPALEAKDKHIESLERDKEKLQKQLDWERLPWLKKWFKEPPK